MFFKKVSNCFFLGNSDVRVLDVLGWDVLSLDVRGWDVCGSEVRGSPGELQFGHSKILPRQIWTPPYKILLSISLRLNKTSQWLIMQIKHAIDGTQFHNLFL